MEKFFQWKEAMDHLEFKRLPPGKKAEKEQVTEEKQELAKNLRSQAKDLLNDLKGKYFPGISRRNGGAPTGGQPGP